MYTHPPKTWTAWEVAQYREHSTIILPSQTTSTKRNVNDTEPTQRVGYLLRGFGVRGDIAQTDW
jgi:hypothetical protein